MSDDKAKEIQLEQFNSMREVINQHSKVIKQLNEKIKNQGHKIDLLKAKLSGLDYLIKNNKNTGNPFGGIF